MIKSFKHKGLEKFFTTGNKPGIQAAHAVKLSILISSIGFCGQSAGYECFRLAFTSTQWQFKRSLERKSKRQLALNLPI